jgi:hypothetical protein
VLLSAARVVQDQSFEAASRWGFGGGFYAGDFARDLRAAVAAVARLPFGADRLAGILCEIELRAANHPG